MLVGVPRLHRPLGTLGGKQKDNIQSDVRRRIWKAGLDPCGSRQNQCLALGAQ